MFLLQAAIFSKQLSIVLEPEAVSVICHHEAGKLVGFDLVKAGSQYVIVDAAGVVFPSFICTSVVS